MGALADGLLVTHNAMDNQIYAFGKGPSTTTVTASPKVTTKGSSVLIEGTVIDIAAGTKQNEQMARFPNGVPAVSDVSMTPWMEYVYIALVNRRYWCSSINRYTDANGNYRNIGMQVTQAVHLVSSGLLTLKANTQLLLLSKDLNHTGHHQQKQALQLTQQLQQHLHIQK
jgi:hypothetical protein